MSEDSELEHTKKLVGALLRMPPKPHSEMKLRKPNRKPTTSPRKKKASPDASAKPKTA